MRRKPKTWFCKVYRVEYYFCVGWTRKEFYKFYTKELNGKRTLENFDQLSGICIEFTNPMGVAIWTEPEDKKRHYRALLHECIHAACFTLDARKAGIDWPTCEPLTYLAEAIFAEALNLKG